jgi:hypothetical protein
VVAAASSPGDAVALVAASSYGRDVSRGMALWDAQRGVQATALWHLRVLAGWLVGGGSEVVRVLASGFEIANVEGLLDELAGRPRARSFELGALALAWPRVGAARTVEELREGLATSTWGDPGTLDPAGIGVALRLAWARLVTGRIPGLRRCGAAAAAIVVARERFRRGRMLPSPASLDARRILGTVWQGATSVTSFAELVSSDARWVFADVTGADVLWRAEARWWTGAAATAARGLSLTQPGELIVASAALLLLVDAHWTCAALEAAQWGASGLETFDALA